MTLDDLLTALDHKQAARVGEIVIAAWQAGRETGQVEEREACAVIAETAADMLQNSTFEGVAAAIRARNST